MQQTGEATTLLSYALFVKPQAWLPVALIQGRIENEVVRNLEVRRQGRGKRRRRRRPRRGEAAVMQAWLGAGWGAGWLGDDEGVGVKHGRLRTVHGAAWPGASSPFRGCSHEDCHWGR